MTGAAETSDTVTETPGSRSEKVFVEDLTACFGGGARPELDLGVLGRLTSVRTAVPSGSVMRERAGVAGLGRGELQPVFAAAHGHLARHDAGAGSVDGGDDVVEVAR